MHERTIALVKSLSVGPCSCTYPMGSCSSGCYDPVTGVFKPGTFDSGPKRQCMRCTAREALEADGIEYVKDDRWMPVMTYNAGDAATACKSFMGEVWVGTVNPIVPTKPEV